MSGMLILIAILIMAFIFSCLTLLGANTEEPSYCKLRQELCSYPTIINCRNCPLYKEMW